MIGIIVGLLLGLLTGFFFEHRATKVARAQNEDLRHELEVLRASVYSLGGDPEPDRRPTIQPAADPLADVRSRALVTQDASGRVRRLELVAHFIERGANANDVQAALAHLLETGEAKEQGRWLQIL